jgi:hypothetical protein
MSPALVALLQFFFIPLLLWELLKLLWPLRLDHLGTRFTTAIFLRYSVRVFTGYVSAIEPGAVEDTRRIFVRHHTRFSLDNHEGARRHVDAINVRPVLALGHLVSVAWVVRDREVGNAFYVYDHDAGLTYIEKQKWGQRNAYPGLVWMVKPLPEWFQAAMAVTIVGIPVLVVIGLAAQWKIVRFGRLGALPLIARMESRAKVLRAAAAGSSAAAL